MGIETIAIVGLAVAGAGVVMNYQQQKKSQQFQAAAANEQRKANAITSAQQAQQADRERRQQIREERIRRATIIQQSTNSGSSGSSGEQGAIGGMSTQLASNLGANGSALMAGQQITGFNQNAANFMTAAQTAQGKGQMWGQIGQFGGSMFAQAGGWQTLFGNPPKTP